VTLVAELHSLDEESRSPGKLRIMREGRSK
jgi:hypothetical protein